MIVTPWHNQQQLDKYLEAWKISTIPEYLLLQQDTNKDGCAVTKNRGIEKAIQAKAEVIVVLDDDCFPSEECQSLERLIYLHNLALQPQQVELFETVTVPQSRGTPYFNRSIQREVAASMGFWLNIGDYDAPSQLAFTATNPMQFARKTIHDKYFALSGMNIAFRSEWYPYCKFVDIARFDDIWSGLIWQKRAYELGYCFNLNGPLVTHSRQSNVWANLKDEAKYLQANETIWQVVHEAGTTDYNTLLQLVLSYAMSFPS